MYTQETADLDQKYQDVANAAARVYAYVDTAQNLCNQFAALATALEAADGDLRRCLGLMGAPAPTREATADAETEAFDRVNRPASETDISKEQDERLLANKSQPTASTVDAQKQEDNVPDNIPGSY